MTVAELQERLVEINNGSQSIIARAEAEKRDLAEEEQKELDELIGEFKAKSADIERMKQQVEAGANPREFKMDLARELGTHFLVRIAYEDPLMLYLGERDASLLRKTGPRVDDHARA